MPRSGSTVAANGGSCQRSACLEHGAAPEVYTLSLHDALPISTARAALIVIGPVREAGLGDGDVEPLADLLPVQHLAKADRKSTRLNSSHVKSSYAVFCLKNNIHEGTHSADALAPDRQLECQLL